MVILLLLIFVYLCEKNGHSTPVIQFRVMKSGNCMKGFPVAEVWGLFLKTNILHCRCSLYQIMLSWAPYGFLFWLSSFSSFWAWLPSSSADWKIKVWIILIKTNRFFFFFCLLNLLLIRILSSKHLTASYQYYFYSF